MQQHEGPRCDPGAEERNRQNATTRWLLLAILILGGLIGAMLFDRWI